MGLFRKTPEEKEAKRKKKFDKTFAKKEELLEKTKDENPKAYQIVYLSLIDDLALFARTEEDFVKSSRLAKTWLEFAIGRFMLDTSKLSFREALKTSAVDGDVEIDDWRRFEDAVIASLYLITAARDFESVVRLADGINGIDRTKIKLSNTAEDIAYSRSKVYYPSERAFLTATLYSGFANYKLGNYGRALEIFNENPATLYITKRFEESYANELFGEFESSEKSQFEIRTSVMIEKIEMTDCE